MRTWVRLTAGSAVLAATVAGCGGTNDSADPAAAQCRAALQARVDAGFAAVRAAPDPVAANAVIANSLAGVKPKACTDITDELGAKLLTQLAGEAAARYRDGIAGTASTGPTDWPSGAPSGAPTATPTLSAPGSPSPTAGTPTAGAPTGTGTPEPTAAAEPTASPTGSATSSAPGADSG